MMLKWRVTTTTEFDDWFAQLEGSAQAEVIAKVELLKVLGPSLRRPHADALHGSRHANMRELRAHTAQRVIRGAFAFDPGRTAILLVAGDKSGVGERAFYRKLIARADRLFDEHLARIKGRPRGA